MTTAHYGVTLYFLCLVPLEEQVKNACKISNHDQRCAFLMEPEDHRLVQRIDAFLRECGAKLDSLSPSPAAMSFNRRIAQTAGAGLAEGTPPDARASGSSPQRSDELRRASQLLREALREWNAEKQEHERTKTMLRLALQELHGIHHSRDLASLVHSSESFGDAENIFVGRAPPPTASMRPVPPQTSTASPTNIPRADANDNETMLEAPSFYFRGSPGRRSASPPSPAHRHHRSVARPLSFSQQEPSGAKKGRLPGKVPAAVVSLRSPYQQVRGTTISASARVSSNAVEQQRRASPTSPFASRVARFQEATAAGDQIVFGTPRENRLNGGLRYKTAADVYELLLSEQSHRPQLHRYAIQAQEAIERLHERLSKSPRSRRSSGQ